MVEILVVDDHAAVRAGLRTLIDNEPGLRVTDAVPDAVTALAAVASSRPDVAIVDFHLPGEDGLRLCLRIEQMKPRPRVVIYSAFADEVLNVLALVAGADAVLCKTADPQHVVEVLRDVAAGVDAWTPPSPEAMSAVAGALESTDLPILAMLVHGTPPRQIAETLGITSQWLHARRWAMLRSRRARRGAAATDGLLAT